MQHYHVDIIKITKEWKEHVKRIVVSANSEADALDNVPEAFLDCTGYIDVTVKITEEEWNAGNKSKND